MQASNPAYHVEILGINSIGAEAQNVAYTAGTTLAWLQDVAGVNVRSAWGASERDVILLNPMNEAYDVYNLFDDPLDPTNTEPGSNWHNLKELFRQTATWLDTDNDTLCDHWEMLHFGNLSHTPTGDPEGDGKDNFTEYTFGTDPLAPSSSSSIQAMVVEQAGDSFLEVEFVRRMGSQVSYLKKHSNDLAAWFEPEPGVTVDEPLQNLFDGTGTGRAKFRVASPVSGTLRRFFQISALPGTPP